MPAKGLSLSVILYLVLSFIGFGLLITRRCMLKGELGGSNRGRYGAAVFLVTLWFVYVTVAGLGTYEIIPDF
jgi:hypothetical protein